ncbi:MAG: hypothetical protein WHS87_06810 [Anaerolineales bacterium]
MPFLTLFTAPKPFTDPHIATIQRNALRSWTLLPDVEVIVLGEEEGLEEVARELGILHLKEVERSPSGAPRLSSMFAQARAHSQSPFLCVINADILLMSDFLQAVREVAKLRERFVLVSQRWDVDITTSLDFAPGWEERLREHVRQHGKLHRPAGSDFFVFPRECYQDIPAFTIGRAGWDNWMIYKARRERWAVIDLTPSVMIVHQNHDYRHLPGGQAHYTHPETEENTRLAGGHANVRYTILDATHQLHAGRLRSPKLTKRHFIRYIELLLRSILPLLSLPEEKRERWSRPRYWIKVIRHILEKGR